LLDLSYSPSISENREKLLKNIFESNVFNKPAAVLRGGKPKGFIPYEAI
jgi:hypothetical protein